MLERVKAELSLQEEKKYKILDAGCGTGNLDLILSAENCAVTAIDFSSAMLERAKKKLATHESISIRDCNLDKTLPFPNDYFDRIVTINVLHALPDPVKTLAEFNRVLKSDGQMIIITLKENYQMPLIVKAFKHAHEPDEKWEIKNIFSWFVRVIKVFGFTTAAFKFIFVAIFNKIIDKKIEGFKREVITNEILQLGLKIKHSGFIYGDQDLFFVLSKPKLLIQVAKSKLDQDRVFVLRQEIFIAEENLPLESDIDEYDAEATHFLASKNGFPVGVMRLIKIPTASWSFRGLYQVPDSFFDFRQALEISRFGFRREYREGQDFVLLLGAAMSYAASCKFNYLCGTMRVELMRALRIIGIRFDFVSEPFSYHGKWQIVAFVGPIEENMKIIETIEQKIN